MSETTMDRATRVAVLEKRVAELEAGSARDATRLRIATRRAMDDARELRLAEEQLLIMRTNLREVSHLIYDAIWSATGGGSYTVSPLQKALDIIERKEIARDHKVEDLQEQLDATGDEAAQLQETVVVQDAKISAMKAEAAEQAAVIEAFDANLRNLHAENKELGEDHVDLQEQLKASQDVVHQLREALVQANSRGSKVKVGDTRYVRRRIPVFGVGDKVTIHEIDVTDAGLVFYQVSGVSSRSGQMEVGRIGSDDVHGIIDADDIETMKNPPPLDDEYAEAQIASD